MHALYIEIALNYATKETHRLLECQYAGPRSNEHFSSHSSVVERVTSIQLVLSRGRWFNSSREQFRPCINFFVIFLVFSKEVFFFWVTSPLPVWGASWRFFNLGYEDF